MWRLAVAYYWGFRDGWDQPYELLMSKNAEYLTSDRYDLDRVMIAMDNGINLGQTLRGGRRSQADQEGYVPFGLRSRLVAVVAFLLVAIALGEHLLHGVINGLTVTFVLAALWTGVHIFTGWPLIRPKSLDRA